MLTRQTTDSEALRSKLQDAAGWHYVETRTLHALETAMRRWDRLREAQQLWRESGPAADAGG